MANKYANLNGSNLIKNEYTKITTGFDLVEVDFNGLAGAGRTTETVKGNSDALNSHMADSVTDGDGAHGLIIETGIWTPTLFGGTVAGSNTYHPNTAGKYIRENNKAICFFRLEVTTVDPLMSGLLRVGNFPFVVKSDNAMRATLNIGLAANITLPEGYTQLVGTMNPGSSFAYFSGIGSNKSAYTLQASDVVSGLRIFGTVTYEIA
jgi:hypothetical protein